jgi:hypothetical protein
VPAYAARLRTLIERSAPILNALPDDAAAHRPAAGKWSPKEIIGHLVDSACNNHVRFVRAQLEEDLVFPGYAQDGWVAVQDYEGAPWPLVREFWRVYNLHLAHVMERAPGEARRRERARHNLAKIGVRIADDEPGTLDRLMEDYVDHQAHHLRQIPGIDV